MARRSARPWHAVASLAACTIYRDDAEYLPEWIEFHRLMGVERFFLYDNGSADDHEQVLAPYVAEGIVVVHRWPHAFLGHNGRPRAIFTAFEDCCGRHAQDRYLVAALMRHVNVHSAFCHDAASALVTPEITG